MRYILIILVFLSVGAKAQMVIKAHANYRPYAQPAVNLLLDDYPNAAAAYSLRKLDKDYTGAAIRVRKDTTGQPEQDIGFTASGDLDTAAIKSFLNARSGFVTIWYDQSGQGRNKTIATQVNQPRIALTGVIERTNNKVSINFQSQHNLISSSEYTITHSVQVARVATLGQINYIYTNASNGFFWNGTFGGITNGLGAFDGTNLRNIGGGDLNQHIGFFSLRSNKIFITRDGGTEIDAGAFATSLSLDRLGGRLGPGLPFLGHIQEIVSWNSDQSSNRAGIQNNINDYYNIYWNGDFTGILDTYPNSAAAYSLRNLSSTYTGPLIRVRKDTTGQPEMDIYGDYYGNLDTVGLKNFLQTRSGFVTTWYDQSGNGRNATQSTASLQPYIANLGVIQRLGSIDANSNSNGIRPAINFGISFNSYFNITAFNTADNYSLYYVQNRHATNRIGIYLGSGNVGGSNFAQWNDGNIYIQYPRSGQMYYRSLANNTIGNTLLEGYVNNTPAASIYRNGALLSGLSSEISFSGTAQWRAINLYGGTNTGNGTISELILYHSNQLSNRTGIATNINTYYSIY